MRSGVSMGLAIVALISVFAVASFGAEQSKMRFDALQIEDSVKEQELDELMVQLVNGLVQEHGIGCAAFVCDSVFLNVFRGEFFRRLLLFSYIMIVPKESEDLLSPNFDTLEALRQVRKDGCEAYVILIANGIQAARLLRFGDRYRLIDTRAKFVILHDFRLFKSELHYLWKRIVNVVFVRKHELAAGPSWFDITTVPFPSPIRGVLLPRRLDTWRRGRFRDSVVLFKDKTQDLRGQTLNVVYLQHVPAVVRNVRDEMNSVAGLGGLEMQILKALSEAVNFSPRIYEPLNAETQQWGQRQVNGSFSGLLGEMVAGKADIALGDLHYTPYHLELTDLTIPYTSQCLTFLTPESLTDNSWKTLILPFQSNMWAAVMAVLFVTGLIFYGLAKYNHLFQNYSHKNIEHVEETSNKLFNKEIKLEVKENSIDPLKNTGLYLFDELTNSILYTFGMLLFVSLPRFPTDWSIRVLTGWYWLYCILLVVAYRASMTAILANPVPVVTIDTLDQLAQSKIGCGGWGSQVKQFFETSLDETGQKIGSVFEMTNDPQKAVDRVAQGTFAYYENAYYLKYAIVRRKMLMKNATNTKTVSTNETIGNGQRNSSGSDHILHIMANCVINMPISLGLEKNSPLKPRADKYLRRVIEAGLVQKWLDDVMLPILTANINKDESVKAIMDLKKLYGGFVALGIGYFLSAVFLVAELIHWHFIVRKDPKFDKYALDIYYSKKK